MFFGDSKILEITYNVFIYNLKMVVFNAEKIEIFFADGRLKKSMMAPL